MNTQQRRVSNFVAISGALAVAAFCAQARLPGKAAASPASSFPALTAAAAESVEETVTLPASNLKTSGHAFQWYSKKVYCSRPFRIAYGPDAIAGTVVAGYRHEYDKGTQPLPCPEGANNVFRGAVWFDLSGIVSKAPPLNVFVKSAKLHFKVDKNCDGSKLLVAEADWLKGHPDNSLIPGVDIAAIPACASGDCAIDVTPWVNNWVKGPEHAGEANHGFLFRGEPEADNEWHDNNSCLSRYSDLRLTVTFIHNKASKASTVVSRRFPEGPVVKGINIPIVERTNVALASNGGSASASSSHASGQFPPSDAINGERKGANWGKGGGWNDAEPAGTYPDWLQVDFGGKKTIDEMDLFTVQDNVDSPSELTEPGALMFSKYGLTSFEMQYWDGAAWVTVPGGAVTGNNQVWRKFSFKPVVTSRVRVLIHGSVDGLSRVTELEAWSPTVK